MNTYKSHINPRKQTPLGALLYQARKAKGLSRADLAELCKIGVNSIVRYEKAGRDEDGQFPPAPKLAVLCYHLEIPVYEAFWSSLTPQDFKMASGTAFEDHSYYDPALMYFQAQYDTLVKDNHFLQEILRGLIGLNEEFPYDDTDRQWLVEQAKKLISRQEDFQSRMLQLGCAQFNVKMTVLPNPDITGSWVHNVAAAGKITAREQMFIAQTMQRAKKQMVDAIENIDRLIPELSGTALEETTTLPRQPYDESPEDDLPSPPSSQDDEN